MKKPPSKRGGKRPGAGAPKGPLKVKLTAHILPETREVLGESPGQAIDALVRAQKGSSLPSS